jgi:spermidine dehydrogenase
MHERVKLLSTPFSAYEESLREDLSRVLAPAGFEFDRDVSAIYIYRWGHGMVYPKPGFPFGSPTSKARTGRAHARVAAHRPRGPRAHLLRRAGRG